MNTHQPRAIYELRALALGKPIEEFQHARLVEDSSCPGSAGGHEAESTHELHVAHRGLRRRVRIRLIVRQDVPVGVPGNERDILELSKHREHVDWMRSEQDEVTEYPPPLDPETGTVTKHGVERAGDAVNI